jgi:hypothetical protein
MAAGWVVFLICVALIIVSVYGFIFLVIGFSEEIVRWINERGFD